MLEKLPPSKETVTMSYSVQNWGKFIKDFYSKSPKNFNLTCWSWIWSLGIQIHLSRTFDRVSMNKRDKDWKLERKFTFKPRSRCCRVFGSRTATFKCVYFTSLSGGFLYYRLVLWLNLRSRRLDVTAQERTGRTREARDSFSPRVFSSSGPFFFMPINFRLTCRPCDVSHWTAQKSQTKPCKNIIYCKTSQKVHTTTQN